MAKKTTVEAGRTFLVIVDRSEELMVALRFACRRASHTGGRVALLCVVEPPEGMGFMAVEALAQSEGREEAEETLKQLSAKVVEWTGQMPIMYIRDGRPLEQLLALIEEDPSVSILVLGADPGPKGPGPLVTALSGKHVAKLRVPLTVVPGNMTEEQIDRLA